MKAIKWVIIQFKKIFRISRSEKELIELMLENTHLFETGLCDWAFRLYFSTKRGKLLSYKEYHILYNIITYNKPNLPIKSYWWEKGDIKPRIEFLNNLLEKYK
jgi:hypothetical protein